MSDPTTSDSPSNYHFHREVTTPTVRDHLRQYQSDKMKRIVAANANTPAGQAIRRASQSKASAEAVPPDQATLLPKKAHWTTEERWGAENSDEETVDVVRAEPGLDNSPKGEQQQDTATTIITTRELSGVKKEKKRKESLGQRFKDAAMTAATGYTTQRKEGMYPT